MRLKQSTLLKHKLEKFKELLFVVVDYCGGSLLIKNENKCNNSEE